MTKEKIENLILKLIKDFREHQESIIYSSAYQKPWLKYWIKKFHNEIKETEEEK